MFLLRLSKLLSDVLFGVTGTICFLPLRLPSLVSQRCQAFSLWTNETYEKYVVRCVMLIAGISRCCLSFSALAIVDLLLMRDTYDCMEMNERAENGRWPLR